MDAGKVAETANFVFWPIVIIIAAVFEMRHPPEL